MMNGPDHNRPTAVGKAIFIIGAGRFGRRAADILCRSPKNAITLVDRDPDRLRDFRRPRVETEVGEGADFIIRHQDDLHPSDIIVPAVPIHLAFVWLTRYLYDVSRTRQIPVPEVLKSELPFTWPGNEGSLLVSYADFTCPADCDEPAGRCAATGETRELPLHEMMSRMRPEGYGVRIIRSLQLAPGVGGYPFKELKELPGKTSPVKMKKWIIGTACRCHGTLSALEYLGPGTPGPKLSQ